MFLKFIFKIYLIIVIVVVRASNEDVPPLSQGIDANFNLEEMTLTSSTKDETTNVKTETSSKTQEIASQYHSKKNDKVRQEDSLLSRAATFGEGHSEKDDSSRSLENYDETMTKKELLIFEKEENETASILENENDPNASNNNESNSSASILEHELDLANPDFGIVPIPKDFNKKPLNQIGFKDSVQDPPEGNNAILYMKSSEHKYISELSSETLKSSAGTKGMFVENNIPPEDTNTYSNIEKQIEQEKYQCIEKWQFLDKNQQLGFYDINAERKRDTVDKFDDISDDVTSSGKEKAEIMLKFYPNATNFAKEGMSNVDKLFKEANYLETKESAQDEFNSFDQGKKQVDNPVIGYTSIWGQLRQKPLRRDFLDSFLERSKDQESPEDMNISTNLKKQHLGIEPEQAKLFDNSEIDGVKSSNNANTNFMRGLDDIDILLEEVEAPEELEFSTAGSSMQDFLISQVFRILKKRIGITIFYIKKSFIVAPRLMEFMSSRRNEDGSIVFLRKYEFQKLCQHFWSTLRMIMKTVSDFLRELFFEDENLPEIDLNFSHEESKLQSIRNKFINA